MRGVGLTYGENARINLFTKMENTNAWSIDVAIP